MVLGGLVLTEKIRGPSQVVATRMSVERARMYSSISGAILIESDVAAIVMVVITECRNRFSLGEIRTK